MEGAGKRTVRPPIRYGSSPPREEQTYLIPPLIPISNMGEPERNHEPTLEEVSNVMDIVSDRLEHSVREVQELTRRLDEAHIRIFQLEEERANFGQRMNTMFSEVNSLKQSVARIELTCSGRVPGANHVSFIPPSSSTFTIPGSSTNHQPNLTSHMSNTGIMGSSFCGPTERLQDVVDDFNGSTSNLHPEKFLSQLELYFSTATTFSDIQRLDAVQRRLTENARMWYESLFPTPTAYTEFVGFFRQRFWSMTTQRKVRNEIYSPYHHRSSTGLTTHAMKWIAKAKYLDPPITQDDLVGTVIQHFNMPIAMALRGRRP